MFVVCVVCCQVEVSATSWSLVQRSPTDCGATLCVIKKLRERGGHSPRCAAEPEKTTTTIIITFRTNMLPLCSGSPLKREVTYSSEIMLPHIHEFTVRKNKKILRTSIVVMACKVTTIMPVKNVKTHLSFCVSSYLFLNPNWWQCKLEVIRLY
jgi:hypothetical protein